MNLCLATLHTQEIADQAALTGPNQERLARASGVAFHSHLGRLDLSRHPAWSKLLLVARLLPLYDAVLWVDTDVVVRSEFGGVVSWMAKKAPVTMFTQPRDGSLNSGVIYFRNCQETLEVLGKVYFQWPMAWDCPWWEQEAFNRQSRFSNVSIEGLDPRGHVAFEGNPCREDSSATFYHAYGPCKKVECLARELKGRR